MLDRAQLSLEYLLLLLAVLSIFAMLLPLLNNIYAMSLFGLDSVNAKRFSQHLQVAIREMSFQADGSAARFEANPAHSWNISSNGKQLLIAVEGPNAEQKLFTVSFPNNIDLPEITIRKKTSFLLKKQSAVILLEYN